jgi:hypothetical protein
MDKRTMKIKHVTTWCTAFLLTGVGAVLVLHTDRLIATPSDAIMLSGYRPHDQATLLPTQITTKATPLDVQTIGVIPEAMPAAEATANKPDEQSHAQAAQTIRAHRDPTQTHGLRHRPLRGSDDYSGNLRITITRSHDVGTWLFPPSQGGGQN